MAVSPVLVLATASLLCCFLRYGDMKYIIVRIPINSRYVFFQYLRLLDSFLIFVSFSDFSLVSKLN